MAFYGSIKAFINLENLLHLLILSSLCQEVKLIMQLPIAMLIVFFKEQQAGLSVFHEVCGGRLWGRGKKGMSILKGVTSKASWGDKGGDLMMVSGIVGTTSQLRGKGQRTLTVSSFEMCPRVFSC